MRIISWNSNCAFRRKFDAIADYNPDIVVVPESESPDDLKRHGVQIDCKSHVWCGETIYKGLSIFTFNGYNARLADFYNDKFKLILPVQVTKGSKTFLLLAVWTKFAENRKNAYIAQACKAVEYYKQYFDKNTIVIGDFNSSKIWDNLFNRHANHSCLLKMLADLGFASVYHKLLGEKQGEESHPTIYLYRKLEKSFHIDYAFMHKSKIKKIKDFRVGEFNDWISLSDHMPMFMEL